MGEKKSPALLKMNLIYEDKGQLYRKSYYGSMKGDISREISQKFYTQHHTGVKQAKCSVLGNKSITAGTPKNTTKYEPVILNISRSIKNFENHSREVMTRPAETNLSVSQIYYNFYCSLYSTLARPLTQVTGRLFRRSEMQNVSEVKRDFCSNESQFAIPSPLSEEKTVKREGHRQNRERNKSFEQRFMKLDKSDFNNTKTSTVSRKMEEPTNTLAIGGTSYWKREELSNTTARGSSIAGQNEDSINTRTRGGTHFKKRDKSLNTRIRAGSVFDPAKMCESMGCSKSESVGSLKSERESSKSSSDLSSSSSSTSSSSTFSVSSISSIKQNSSKRKHKKEKGGTKDTRTRGGSEFKNKQDLQEKPETNRNKSDTKRSSNKKHKVKDKNAEQNNTRARGGSIGEKREDLINIKATGGGSVFDPAKICESLESFKSESGGSLKNEQESSKSSSDLSSSSSSTSSSSTFSASSNSSSKQNSSKRKHKKAKGGTKDTRTRGGSEFKNKEDLREKPVRDQNKIETKRSSNKKHKVKDKKAEQSNTRARGGSIGENREVPINTKASGRGSVFDPAKICESVGSFKSESGGSLQNECESSKSSSDLSSSSSSTSSSSTFSASSNSSSKQNSSKRKHKKAKGRTKDTRTRGGSEFKNKEDLREKPVRDQNKTETKRSSNKTHKVKDKKAEQSNTRARGGSIGENREVPINTKATGAGSVFDPAKICESVGSFKSESGGSLQNERESSKSSSDLSSSSSSTSSSSTFSASSNSSSKQNSSKRKHKKAKGGTKDTRTRGGSEFKNKEDLREKPVRDQNKTETKRSSNKKHEVKDKKAEQSNTRARGGSIGENREVPINTKATGAGSVFDPAKICESVGSFKIESGGSLQNERESSKSSSDLSSSSSSTSSSSTFSASSNSSSKQNSSKRKHKKEKDGTKDTRTRGGSEFKNKEDFREKPEKSGNKSETKRSTSKKHKVKDKKVVQNNTRARGGSVGEKREDPIKTKATGGGSAFDSAKSCESVGSFKSESASSLKIEREYSKIPSDLSSSNMFPASSISSSKQNSSKRKHKKEKGGTKNGRTRGGCVFKNREEPINARNRASSGLIRAESCDSSDASKRRKKWSRENQTISPLGHNKDTLIKSYGRGMVSGAKNLDESFIESNGRKYRIRDGNYKASSAKTHKSKIRMAAGADQAAATFTVKQGTAIINIGPEGFSIIATNPDLTRAEPDKKNNEVKPSKLDPNSGTKIKIIEYTATARFGSSEDLTKETSDLQVSGEGSTESLQNSENMPAKEYSETAEKDAEEKHGVDTLIERDSQITPKDKDVAEGGSDLPRRKSSEINKQIEATETSKGSDHKESDVGTASLMEEVEVTGGKRESDLPRSRSSEISEKGKDPITPKSTAGKESEVDSLEDVRISGGSTESLHSSKSNPTSEYEESRSPSPSFSEGESSVWSSSDNMDYSLKDDEKEKTFSSPKEKFMQNGKDEVLEEHSETKYDSDNDSRPSSEGISRKEEISTPLEENGSEIEDGLKVVPLEETGKEIASHLEENVNKKKKETAKEIAPHLEETDNEDKDTEDALEVVSLEETAKEIAPHLEENDNEDKETEDTLEVVSLEETEKEIAPHLEEKDSEIEYTLNVVPSEGAEKEIAPHLEENEKEDNELEDSLKVVPSEETAKEIASNPEENDNEIEGTFKVVPSARTEIAPHLEENVNKGKKIEDSSKVASLPSTASPADLQLPSTSDIIKKDEVAIFLVRPPEGHGNQCPHMHDEHREHCCSYCQSGFILVCRRTSSKDKTNFNKL